MNDTNLKNELLKQDAAQPSADVAQLRTMVEAEDRRARRLTRWAIIIWSTFFLMVMISLVVPKVQARLNPRPSGASTMPAAPPTLSQQHDAGMVVMVVGVFAGAVFFALPPTGIALTIMAFMSRRTLSKRQILARLASIESQLQLLTSTKARSQEG